VQLTSQQGFDSQLKYGQEAERHISRWLMSRGWSILPVYETEGLDYKGPRFFTASKQLVAPDLLAIKQGRFCWVEAKHKTVFSWYRIGQYWCTGIDVHHWLDYQKLATLHPSIDFWILFLHRQVSTPEGDGRSPIGLFGNRISKLAVQFSHMSDKWGRHGMIYWALSHLKLLAPLRDLVIDTPSELVSKSACISHRPEVPVSVP